MLDEANQEVELAIEQAEVLTEEQQQKLETQSAPFVGKWNLLISTTNWEKGTIIIAWQKAMAKSGLPKSSYSDDRWSQLCGGATPQHVGRLRRTQERFGHVFKEYEGLYWSHFYAALDWDDSEMWLEGAIQNDWSVSKMRNARWETMGQRPEDKPRVEQIVVSELEEEVQSVQARPVSTTATAKSPKARFMKAPILVTKTVPSPRVNLKITTKCIRRSQKTRGPKFGHSRHFLICRTIFPRR